MEEVPSRFSAYPPAGVWKRVPWILAEMASRGLQIGLSRSHQVSIIQRELISTLPTLERLTVQPRILDVDDAIWLYRNGLACDYIAKHSDFIVCGNSYLAGHFLEMGKRTQIIPTPVDTERFRPVAKGGDRRPVIGWSGTSGGLPYLQEIEKPLAEVLRQNPEWVFRVVSDRPLSLPAIPAAQFEYLPWSEATEVETIATMDIGLMPTDRSDWALGKCSYKMLLYMACAIPVVVTAIGMNQDLLAEAEVGLGALAADHWYDALSTLVRDAELCRLLGTNGRALVEKSYSLGPAADLWAKVIQGVLSK